MEPIHVEIRQLFRLAFPLMGAQLAQMGMGVTDAIMAGNYSSVDLAGVALGTSILWPVLMLFMGLVQAVTPTVSQLNGARNYPEIGEVIRQGLWLALVGGILGAFMLNNIEPVYQWLNVDPSTSAISIAYLSMCSMGLPALMCFFALRFLADGMGFTRPALLISVSALALKIPLNYVLIHGEFGLPEYGGVGCGIAQAIIMWFQLFLVILVVTGRRFDKTQWLRRITPPDWQRIKPLLIIGLPIGATIFAEMSVFSFTTLLLGQFGPEVVAAHNISMNINGVFFMPPMALGMAATIRIGFRVGEEDALNARSTALIAMGATMLVALFGAGFIYLLRQQLVSMYTLDSDVLALANQLLMFVIFFLIFDASQSTATGALRGYKDTRVPMLLALFSFWIVGLPLECALGFGWFGEPMGVYGFWIGLFCAVATASVLITARLWYVSGNDKTIRRLSFGSTDESSL